MEADENFLTFFLIYNDIESTLQLLEYDTVEVLKRHIFLLFDILPHEQELEGWRHVPESDDTILQMCAQLNNITCLVIRSRSNNSAIMKSADDNEEELEVDACTSFINKFLTKDIHSSINFHSCKLRDAITDACLRPLEERKALLLYLHKEDDIFTSIFDECLQKPDLVGLLNKSFFFLGWDIDETRYRDALTKALNNCSDLLTPIDIQFKAIALCLVPVNDSVMIFSCLCGKKSYADVLTSLKEAENFLVQENQQEMSLLELEQQTGNENDFGSVSYQKLMADMLGDRDYDVFEFDQHEHLKDKIAFAQRGPPQTTEGYNEEQKAAAESLYKVILENSNEIAKYKDTVEISFIYNCTEPLPSEKLRRAASYVDYRPNTDLTPYPIFVLRKCRGSANPCRIFVDHMGRTYNNWGEYINRNKLSECEMILPYGGRYEVDEAGEVRLERHLSPACGLDVKILQGADYVSTAGGLISGSIFLAAAIPSVAVAPVALVAGGVIGLGVGVYSIIRSAYALYDRSRHRETMSFANSEARGAYLNIVAGSLGFVGAGATMAVSQLAARGVNIGRGAGAVVDAIAFVNIGASSISVINSGYDVFDQWYNENQTPSLLTIVQLSSSILFFGNAVYNFRSCSSIVEEVQARTLQDYNESLRSNRHRKTFNKLLKETIRQNNGNEIRGKAEVISAIRNIQNKDEVFAVLTRSNKEMNRNGIKFAALEGEIRLNGVKIDMHEFVNMNKKDASSFLSLLSKSEASPIERASMSQSLRTAFSNFTIEDVGPIANFAVKLFGNCTSEIKSKIISALAALLAKLTGPILRSLDEIFSRNTKLLRLMEMTVNFFGKAAEGYDQQYNTWKETGDEQYYSPMFDYVDVNKAHRVIQLFEKVVNMCYIGANLTEAALRELIEYFYNWFSVQVYEFQERRERDQRRRMHSGLTPSRRIRCTECGGFYYNI